MFTGIIKTVGVIQGSKPASGGGLTLSIEFGSNEDISLEPGMSLAVNGVCLTVTSVREPVVEVDVSSETVERTTFSTLARGTKVNLEPALTPGTPLDGHFVSGHVDGTVDVLNISKKGCEHGFRFSYPEKLAPFLARKGSVALDGISLTVNRVEEEFFTTKIVPYTFENTILNRRKPGDAMNLEVDLLARYLYNFWQSGTSQDKLDKEQLFASFSGGDYNAR